MRFFHTNKKNYVRSAAKYKNKTKLKITIDNKKIPVDCVLISIFIFMFLRETHFLIKLREK